MEKASTRNNFSYFLASLLALLFCSALFDQFSEHAVQYLIEAGMIVTILIFIFSVNKSKAWLRSGIGVICIIILSVFCSLILDLGDYVVFHLVFLIAFYVAALNKAAKQVLFRGEIDANSIVGSICIYILLGMIWGFLYMLTIAIWPDSIKGLPNQAWYKAFSDAMYFSFVTLTTLGYGDISPNTPVAKFLVYLETIIGQFYLAIFVASIISIRLASKSDEKHSQSKN